MKQLEIFIAFFRSSILGYGGGPSTIPLVYKEVVDTYKWMKDEEFSEILAIGNMLPGPINTKLAGYIGYRIGGIIGMLNAIIASILPTILLMIILLTSLSSFKDIKWVNGMKESIVPVVGVMLGVLTWQFYQSSKKGLKTPTILIHLVVGLLLIQFLHIYPAIIIGGLLIFAIFQPVKATSSNDHQTRKGSTNE
ncbi:chromate transporter [Bacillus sp. AFS088145]|uniref:chromate transporter n=1 Tax=Bacillus sp. AFS088145 TaxID=2033514 RepID=UPI000BF5AF2B|nr:chromate transporter [Bacillus sp. AFS088145]PFH83001.1 chromate transporter [Bacillus sp. AFS088145]